MINQSYEQFINQAQFLTTNKSIPEITKNALR